MNKTKSNYCDAIREMKEENDLTYKSITSMYFNKTKKVLTDDQLNRILNKQGKGVSVDLMDEIAFVLGYEISILSTPNYTWL